MKHIAIIDDDQAIHQILRPIFEMEGFAVSSAYNGSVGMELVRRYRPDLIVLDVMLPDMDGWNVCRTLRHWTDVPIIMLTALGFEEDRLQGLELGADDYIAKPFSAREVLARARAVLRRTNREVMPAGLVSAGRLLLEEKECRISDEYNACTVTPAEFRILKNLALHKGRVLSREQLMDNGSGEPVEGFDRTVDAHIKNLRRKLSDAGMNPDLIQTVHGIGYRLVDAVD